MLHIIRRVTTLILCLCLTCFTVRAERVSVEKAADAAAKFFTANSGVQTRSNQIKMRLARTSETLESKSGAPTFYVFCPEDGSKGFVIVSAETGAKPIIGYSFDANVGEGPLPENIEWWFSEIDHQIREFRQSGQPVSEKAKMMWENVATKGSDVLLFETALWNQHAPFNNECPLNGSDRTITGCTATATAIIMRHNKWPQFGKGKTTRYTNKDGDVTITVPERDLNHAYDWDKMPLNYSASSTDAEKNAVAVLMADIGAAFRAQYGKSSTSASVDREAMYKNFSYSPSFRRMDRDDYDDEVWKKTIRDEVKRINSPILYRGEKSGGHIFVLDGFTDDDYFHFNWGWGGSYNGYYSLDNFVMGSHNYTEKHMIYLNMTPEQEDEKVIDWLTMRAPGMVVQNTDFENVKIFSIDTLRVYNATGIAFAGQICVAHTDRNGNIKEWVTDSITCTTDNPINSGIILTYRNFSCNIETDIQFGDRLMAFYKEEGSDEWTKIESQEKNCTNFVLLADEFDIANSTSFEFSRIDQKILLHIKTGVSVILTDSSGADKSDVLTITDNLITVNTTSLPFGEYKFILKKGTDEKELRFSLNQLEL